MNVFLQSKKPLSNLKEKPLYAPILVGQTQYVYDEDSGEYIAQKKIFSDYLQEQPSRLNLEEFLEAKAQEEKRARFYARLNDTLQNPVSQSVLMDSLKLKFGVDGETFLRMFGSNQVAIEPKGLFELSLGVASQKLDNPAIPKENRRQSLFDFNFKSNLSMVGNVGSKLNLLVNYSTDAAFDYQNDLRIEYTGEPDEIIKNIEVGNIGMRVPSQLIRGGESLFGGKITTQFGPFTATALIAAQKGENRSISIKNGGTYQQKELLASDYLADRFFYFSLYFRQQYDKDLQLLPHLPEGSKLIKVEVWITNTIQSTDNNRNIVAFTDLGENPSTNLQNLAPYQRYTYRDFNNIPLNATLYPDNNNNALYNLRNSLRNFNSVKFLLEQPQNFLVGNLPLVEGEDFERIQNARMLNPADYQINERLGFISLNQRLKPNDVLAIAYQYTDPTGKIHQVGEFASDVTDVNQTLLAKTLKGTYLNPNLTLFHLMMKNVYSLNALQVSPEDFRLLFLYRNAKTGIDVDFIPQPGLENSLLVQLLGFDLLNSILINFPDGEYDFVDNAAQVPGTIDSQKGLIFLPAAEPFGTNLAQKITEKLINQNPVTVNTILNEVVFNELYTQTQIEASLITNKNLFKMKAIYRSEFGSEIILDAANIPQGSIRVRVGGLTLAEGIDYIVNYSLGHVKIINEALLQSGQTITIDFEANGIFNVQQKVLTGLQLDYAIDRNMNLGFTYLYASEKPFNINPIVGSEAYANHVLGLQYNIYREAPFLTRWAEAIPTVFTREPSYLSAQVEAAYFIPTTPTFQDNKKEVYLDDFETFQNTIDLKQPSLWKPASVPQFLYRSNAPNPDFNQPNVTLTNLNRALLSWYVIDPLFLNDQKDTPNYLNGNLSEQGSLYQREIFADEIYPNREYEEVGQVKIPTLDLAYYPNERGMYNFDANALQSDGSLSNPQSRWSGMMRALPLSNFEQANVEYVQILVMNPYETEAFTNGHAGSGRLRIQLGDISEEILKGTGSFHEAALPSDEAQALNTQNLSAWGRANTQAAMVYQFIDRDQGRFYQDVGLDGIINSLEQQHYNSYLQNVQTRVTNPSILQKILQDPSGDDYIAALDEVYNQKESAILERYKYVNGVEGNASNANPTTATPDGNDLNNDYNTQLNERLIEIEIPITPANFQLGVNPYIVSETEVDLSGKTATSDRVKWFLLRIPLADFQGAQARDLFNLRFMRLLFEGFDAPIVLRLAQLELLTSEWRALETDLDLSAVLNSEVQVSAVNVEEHFSRQPVNYVSPPGVQRQIQYLGNQPVQQNEQALEAKFLNLADQEARAVFKNVQFDLLSYGEIKMFVHLEEILGSQLNEGDLTFFIRLGSDATDNYYEYALPLSPTNTASGFVNDPYLVWPEKNNVAFSFKDLQTLKLNRNRQNASLTQRFSQSLNRAILTIKGNPNLAAVKNILIGVQNNSGRTISAVLWTDELRLSSFNNPNAWAVLAKGQMKMADLWSVNLSTETKSIGWGDLQSRVNDRQRATTTLFDVNSTLEMGKFFGNRVGVRLPVFVSYQLEQSLPQFDPLFGDVNFQTITEVSGKEESKQRQKQATATKEQVSVQVTNVGVQPIFQKPLIYEPANFSLSYGYAQENYKDILVSEDFSFRHQAIFTYQFSQPTPYWTAYKPSNSIQNDFDKWLKSFQFGYAPSQLYFSSEWLRTYFQRKDANVFNNESAYRFEKNLLWNRIYKYQHAFTKYLRLSYNALNQSFVEEPNVLADKKINPEGYKATQEALWNNLSTLGINLKYEQRVEVDYTLPIDQLSYLDWIKINMNYKGAYLWERTPPRYYQSSMSNIITGNYQDGALIASKDDVGNTLGNSRNLTFSTVWDFNRLYYKSKNLRESDRRLRGSSVAVQEKASFSDYALKFATMIRRVQFEYVFSDATDLKGYNQDAVWLGLNSKLSAPNFLFLWGHQDQNLFKPLSSDDPEMILNLANNGYIVQRPWASPYQIKHNTEYRFRLSTEPLPSFTAELFFNQKRTETQSGSLFYEPNNEQFVINGKTMTGYFSTSFMSLGSAFASDQKFKQFLTYREKVSQNLGQTYNQIPDVNNPGYYTGFGPTQQEVVLNAFIDIYGNKNEKIRNPLLLLPIPNWRFSYSGLTNFEPIRQYFKVFTLSHEYNSTFALNNFTTLSEEAFSSNLDASGNLILFNNGLSQRYTGAQIVEKFAPFLDFYMDLVYNIQIKFGLNIERALTLTLIDGQLSEQNSQQYYGSVGYRFTNWPFTFMKKRYPAEFVVRLDASWKDIQNTTKQLSDGDEQLLNGSQLLNIRGNIEYTINQFVGMMLYLEHTFLKPFNSTQFNSLNTRAGLTLRLILD